MLHLKKFEILRADFFADSINRNAKKCPKHTVKRTNLPLYIKPAIRIIPDLHFEFKIDNTSAQEFIERNDSTADNTFRQHSHTLMTLVYFEN